MRVNNALALRDKCPTAKAVVKLLANIRRNRPAKAALQIAHSVPKTATGATTGRLATRLMS